MTGVTAARPAEEVLAWSRQLFDPALREAVATLPETNQRITGYHFGWWDTGGNPVGAAGVTGGGKALRPALVLLAARAIGGDPLMAVPAAVAVELVHNFSLIHDDVIDGDLTRRHRSTVWSVFGTGAAILAGSALLGLACDVLAASGHPSTPAAVRMLGAATLELLEGQQLDLSFESRTDVGLAECLEMTGAKSAALLGCACALGATVAGAGECQVRRLRDFGERLGLAFQLTDDLLGIWGDPALTGKPVHADLRRRKKSLPVVAALTVGRWDSPPSGAPAPAPRGRRAAATPALAASQQLADLYRDDRPLVDRELALAAELVERAGGRAWSQATAAELLADALQVLRSAVEPTRPAAAELAALARLSVHRDR